MTTGIEELKPPKQRKGRGPGKKPALACTSLRLPKYVMQYFEQFPNKQGVMREVLTKYVEEAAPHLKPSQGENRE